MGIAYDGLSKLMDDAYRKEESSKSVIDPILFFFLLMTVFCAFYSMVIFTLISLYSRTAAGLGRDKLIPEFLENTATIRENAFLAFQWSIFIFFAYMAVLPISYFILPNLDSIRKNGIKFLFGLSILLFSMPLYIWSYLQVKIVIKTALPIFANRQREEEQKQEEQKQESKISQSKKRMNQNKQKSKSLITEENLNGLERRNNLTLSKAKIPESNVNVNLKTPRNFFSYHQEKINSDIVNIEKKMKSKGKS